MMRITLLIITIFLTNAALACPHKITFPHPSWDNSVRWVAMTSASSFDTCKLDKSKKAKAWRVKAVSQELKNCQTEEILKKQANGCSWELAGSGFADRDKRILTASCNEHDKCYATPGMSKKQCDDAFQVNLDASCDKFFCGAAVEELYESVKNNGGKLYQAAQAWGNEHCPE